MNIFYTGKNVSDVDTLDIDYPTIFKAVGSRNWGDYRVVLKKAQLKML